MYIKPEPKRALKIPQGLVWLTVGLLVLSCTPAYKWRPYSHPMDRKTIEWMAVCSRKGAENNKDICKPKIPSHAYKWIQGVRDQQELIKERLGR